MCVENPLLVQHCRVQKLPNFGLPKDPATKIKINVGFILAFKL
jgi:hypothetical protein